MSVKTQGTELYFLSAETTPAIVKVDCVVTINGLSAPAEQLDDTCLDSPARVFVSGMKTPGAGTFLIRPDPTDSSHLLLHDMYKAGTKVDWALGMSDGIGIPPTTSGGAIVLPATRSWLDFEAYIQDFPWDFAINALVESTVTIQLSEDPNWTPKT